MPSKMVDITECTLWIIVTVQIHSLPVEQTSKLYNVEGGRALNVCC